jgi:hypothetical protein
MKRRYAALVSMAIALAVGIASWGVHAAAPTKVKKNETTLPANTQRVGYLENAKPTSEATPQTMGTVVQSRARSTLLATETAEAETASYHEQLTNWITIFTILVAILATILLVIILWPTHL